MTFEGQKDQTADSYGRREIELLLEVTGVEHAPGGYRS